MEVISNTALISINETLIFQVISFLIFLLLINRVMFRPLQDVMDQRVRYLEGIRQEIKESENEVERLIKRIEEERNAVQTEAMAVAQKIESDGKIQADEMLASVKKEIESLRIISQQEVGSQISEARNSIRREAEVLAVHIMEKVADRRLSL